MWLNRQALWQIYLPAQRYFARSLLNEVRPNAVNQADVLYLPHANLNRKTYKFASNIFDIVSSCKEAEALTDKSPTEVATAVTRIYEFELPI